MKARKYLVLVALMGAAAAVHADILVNTFGPTGSGFFTVGWTVDSTESLGKVFSTSNDFTLSEIDVALRMSSETDQMLVSLRSDEAGQPGTTLESFTVSSAFGAGGSGLYSLASNLNPLMLAGTYYVTIEPLNDSSGKWNLNNGGGQGAMVVSTDGGSTWNGFTDTNGAVRVLGAPVPEPATMTVLGLATLALIKRRRRRS